jgi:hypothetical protein
LEFLDSETSRELTPQESSRKLTQQEVVAIKNECTPKIKELAQSWETTNTCLGLPNKIKCEAYVFE